MEFKYKIRYAETDQMGIVHHSNYLLYLEQARIEWLEKKGINYSQLEKDGIMLPVYNININYKKPIGFGDTVKVKVKFGETSLVRITFEYELFNSKEDLVVTAQVVLVFMSAQSRKPMKCPPRLYQILTS